MASRSGGVATNGGAIPSASRKMVQSLKEIVKGVSDAEIYVALKECNMDPNEAVNCLLTQGETDILGFAFG
ncbi:putative GBF-interacting protein [Helianthus annuus]|nr:putative GBF-interacting protein [Helianthus annuus]